MKWQRLGDAGEIKKRWKNTWKNCTKKDLNDSDNYNDMVSHPELDILECEVKWALGSTAVNRDSGCNRIPVELFKTLKDDAIKMLTFNMLSKSGRPSSSHKIGKGQSSSQVPRRVALKNVQTIGQLHSSPMLER